MGAATERGSGLQAVAYDHHGAGRERIDEHDPDASQVWLRGFDRIWSWKQDAQAEEFAAYLTVPESENPGLYNMSPEDVARKYLITVELAELRLRDMEPPRDVLGLQGRGWCETE